VLTTTARPGSRNSERASIASQPVSPCCTSPWVAMRSSRCVTMGRRVVVFVGGVIVTSSDARGRMLGPGSSR